MNTSSPIESVVMRRVHRIRVLRFIFSGVTLSVIVSVLALWGIGREVWVARVFENAPADFARLPHFFLAAFTQTRLIVQALTLLTLISIGYSAREIARTLSSVFVPVRA